MISDRIIASIIGHRRLVLAVVGTITLAFGAFIPTIEVNNDPRSSIPPSLEEMRQYDKLQEIFRTPRNLLFTAKFPTDLRLRAKIDSVAAWAKRFKAINGVELAFHLGSVKVPIQGGFLGVTSEYIVPRSSQHDDEQLRERIRRNEDFTGAFVSKDERVLGMLLSTSESVPQTEVAKAVRDLEEQLNRAGPAEVLVTGASLYAYEIDQAMRRDFALLLPLCFVIVFALLYAVYRRLYYVMWSLGVISIALVWTFGLMGVTGIPFSVVTAMTPVILFPIGVASAIHVFKTYARNRSSNSTLEHAAVIQSTFRELLKPIFLSAITTFFGFASFAFSRTIWTRNFGIFTSVGVIFAFLLSVLLLPIALTYDRDDEGRLAQRPGLAGLFPESFWGFYSRFVITSYRWLIVVAVIVVVGIVGFLQVRIEGNPVMMFPQEGSLRRADEVIGRYLGGTRFMHVVLSPDTKDAIENEDWADIQAIARHLDSDTLVGGSTSLLPLITRVSTILTGKELSDAALSMVLGGKGVLGRAFGNYVNAWVTPDKEHVKLTLICRNVSGTPYQEFAQRTREYIANNYPEWDVLVAGPPLLNDAMTHVLVETQVSSMLISFGLVLLVLCLLFRSVRVGVFAITPIVLSTIFVYALMGLFNVAINSVTIITVNTCIGIGIDYAIHFVSGYFYACDHHFDHQSALLATARRKGSVIMFNTFVVGIGFLVLSFSTFPPIRHFGIFVSISMLASSTFALIFPPALFSHAAVGCEEVNNA